MAGWNQITTTSSPHDSMEPFPSDFLNSTSSLSLPEIKETVKYEFITPEDYVLITQSLSPVIVAIALVGVILNILNIKTFIMMGLKDGVAVSFLALAISDFLYEFMTTMQSSSRLFSQIENMFGLWFAIDPFAVDIFSNIAALGIQTISTLITAFIAIVRCMCVAKPLTFKNMFTRSRCLYTFLAFTVCSVILYSPLLGNMGMQTKFNAAKNDSRQVLWLSKDRERIRNITFSFSYLYLSVITQVTLVTSVIVMTSKLRKSVQFRQKETETTNKDSTKLTGKERSVVIQVVAIALICITCNLVKMTHGLLSSLDPKYYIGQPRHYFFFTMASLRVAFDSINSCANFFVYLIFNSKFRSLCFTCSSK